MEENPDFVEDAAAVIGKAKGVILACAEGCASHAHAGPLVAPGSPFLRLLPHTDLRLRLLTPAVSFIDIGEETSAMERPVRSSAVKHTI